MHSLINDTGTGRVRSNRFRTERVVVSNLSAATRSIVMASTVAASTIAANTVQPVGKIGTDDRLVLPGWSAYSGEPERGSLLPTRGRSQGADTFVEIVNPGHEQARAVRSTSLWATLPPLAIVALGLAASGCAPDPPDAGTRTNGVVVTVQALDNTFRPQDLVIEAGTEVLFENVGRNEHDVIPEPDSPQGWGVGRDLFAPGDTYSRIFSEPGVYEYVCSIHGVNRKGMIGTITVTD
jgi:plastocyanin